MSIDETPHGDAVRQSNAEFVEVSIILRRSQVHRINYAQTECGLKSYTEILSGAVTLFLWALDEVKRGRRIASYDEVTDQVEMVHIPAFAKFDTFGRREVKPKDFFNDVTVVKPWWKRILGGA